MQNNKNILKIYENTIDKFLENCPENNKQDIRKLYSSYLVRTYSRLNLDDSSVEYFSELEIIKWKNFSLEGKLSVVCEDNNLDELIKLSMEGLEAADQFRKSGVVFDKNVASKKIKLMEELLDKVLYFNKSLATYYCSEGSLDFSYAAGLADIMSLRTGRSI